MEHSPSGVGIIGTGLLVICLFVPCYRHRNRQLARTLFVFITLFDASAIDEAGKTTWTIEGHHCC